MAGETATIWIFSEVRPLVGKVRSFSAILALALCICTAHANGAEFSIEPHTAKYQISVGILKGTLVSTVVKNDSGFSATSVVKAKGGIGKYAKNTITEHAEFMVENGQIQPVLFSSIDELSDRPKTLNFLFDREAGIVSGTVNDARYEYPLDDDLYDRVIADIRSGVKATDYRLMDGKKIKAITIRHLPSKQVTIPYGEFDVVGIEHDDVRKERRTVIWLAAELGHTPVLIEHYRKGRLLGRISLQDLGKPASASD